jgi:hypothetical protein
MSEEELLKQQEELFKAARQKYEQRLIHEQTGSVTSADQTAESTPGPTTTIDGEKS